MHLERNLNPAYRTLRVLSGVILLVIPFVVRGMYTVWLTAALVLCGVISIASGAYGH
jgi:hypothetical protein